MATPIIHLQKREQRKVLIKAIKEWIQACRFDELNFDDIAQSLHMSPRTLRRHLKNHELCYKDLIKLERKRSAAQLIKAGSLSLEEIGACLGYKDASSFSRAFKNWYGMSPSAYQQQHHSEKRKVNEVMTEVA